MPNIEDLLSPEAQAKLAAYRASLPPAANPPGPVDLATAQAAPQPADPLTAYKADPRGIEGAQDAAASAPATSIVLPGPKNADGSMAGPPTPAPAPAESVTPASLPSEMPTAGKGAGPATDESDESGDGETAPAPAKAAVPSVNPVVAKYLADQKAMSEAQDQARHNRLSAGLARAGAMLGHAISRDKQPLDESGLKVLDENANTPVTDLQARQAAGLKSLQDQQSMLQTKGLAEADDPDSSVSKTTRQLYQDLFTKSGLDPHALDGMSASQVKEYAQNPTEAAEKLRSIEANKALQMEMMKGRAEEARTTKQTNAYNSTVALLEQMRGSPAAGQAERDIYAAYKANRLITTFAPDGDLNRLSDGPSKLLQMEVGKIAQGGQSSVAELNSLDPHTLTGALAKTWGQLSNNPTAANAGAFLKQYKDYADGLTLDAQKVISDRYGRVINTRDGEFTPEQRQKLNDNYINRFAEAAKAAHARPSGPAVGAVKYDKAGNKYVRTAQGWEQQ